MGYATGLRAVAAMSDRVASAARSPFFVRNSLERSRVREFALYSVLLLGVSLSHRVAAQAPNRVATSKVRSTSVTPCAGCRITVEAVTTIGRDENDDGLIEGMVMEMAVTRDSLIVVTGNAFPTVYDLRGKFLRTLGRKGSGPGEFPVKASRFFVADNDDLVFTIRGFTAVVYRASGKFVRQFTFEQSASDPIVLTSGEIAARAPRRSMPLNKVVAEPPIRLFDSTGRFLHTVGMGISAADGPLFAGTDGSIWSTKSFPYSFSRWNTKGDLLTQFDRIVPTFREGRLLENTSKGPFVQPQVLTVKQHQDGLLWVTYFDAPPPKGCVSDFEDCWPSKLEVLDPATGALIAATTLPVQLNFNLGYGYFASVKLRSGGGEPVTIYRARLVRPSTGTTR